MVFCIHFDCAYSELNYSKTMKSVTKRYGLSARRKTTVKASKKGPIIKPLWILFTLASLVLFSCGEKNNTQSSAELAESKSSIVQDSTVKPKVNIKVNKHYGPKGNVIGFDSTYSSYYSNMRHDTVGMDSLMRNFDRYFNSNHASFFNKEFKPLFFGDSLRYPDFFHSDFFMKRYELNDAYMRNMMHRMDSIKNNFYHDRSKTGKDLRGS
jgi:hypothetical protein